MGWTIMLVGHRTWIFKNNPVIISTGTVGGPFEAKGNLAKDFDVLHGDKWFKQDSFENVQQKLMKEACQIALKNVNMTNKKMIEVICKIALKKINMTKEQIHIFILSVLINQITSSIFAAETIGVSYFGLFSACATSMESLSLAAMMINASGAN